MSAYVCHDDTINLIASAARRCGRGRVSLRIPASAVRRPANDDLSTFDEPEIARLLHAENVYSVNYRYNEQAEAEPFHYRYVDTDGLCGGRDLRWEQIVLGSIRCLRYQSCESPDYDQSAAKHVLDTIEAEMVRKLTSEAPWGWTREWTAERSAKIRGEIRREMGLHA